MKLYINSGIKETRLESELTEYLPLLESGFIVRKGAADCVIEFTPNKDGSFTMTNHTFKSSRQADRLEALEAINKAIKWGQTLIASNCEEWPEVEIPATVVLSNGIRQTIFTIYANTITVTGDGYQSIRTCTIEDGLKSIHDHKVMGHHRVA